MIRKKDLVIQCLPSMALIWPPHSPARYSGYPKPAINFPLLFQPDAKNFHPDNAIAERSAAHCGTLIFTNTKRLEGLLLQRGNRVCDH